MHDTIIIGGQPVQRTVSGAIGRLELAVAADADLRADVEFLRKHINAVEAQLDDLAEVFKEVVYQKNVQEYLGLATLHRVSAILSKLPEVR